MKIAIVAPSPIPFTIGGAEKLWLGLYNYINTYTSHQCELIKIPIKEDNFYNLIEAYYTFYKLDLSHFDMVISGKYPAWMTKHPNHHIYMLHTLRGLYDLYDQETQDKNTENFFKDIDSIDTLFEKLRVMKNTGKSIRFPSYFAKRVIHYLDKRAMQNIKSFFAISKTIAQREEYFHNNNNIKVVYPPTNLTDLTSLRYNFFFVVSRLDKPKRIDLLIKAYKKTDTDIPLKIAGVGSEYKSLKKLASDDNRIEFLGFVDEQNLKEYYANAFAVIFIPYQEDYGLVTIESMKSKKAVITMDDSGGVLEFVEHKKTGLIAVPKIDSLYKNIDFLSKNPILAKEYGENAYQKVKDISWQRTVTRLLSQRKRITVLSTYPIYPPRGGGQNRVFYLYKELAKWYDITILSLVSSSFAYSKKEIAQNLFEVQIPKSKDYEENEMKLEKLTGISVGDLFFMENFLLAKDYVKQFKILNVTTDIFITTSPYCFPMLKNYTTKPFIYDSQNVEYYLKSSMLNDSKESSFFLNKLFDIEKECYQNSIFTTACSKNDISGLKKLYGDNKKLYLLPNGVDTFSIQYFTKDRKKIWKDYFGFSNKKIAIFIGSAHKPNIQAVYEILAIADKFKNMEFIIVGGLNVYFTKTYSSNITFVGMVNNNQKERYLAVADIALNPMKTGSGTNLKVLEYLASGIPTISTKIGVRGLELPKNSVFVAEIKEWDKYLSNLNYYIDTKSGRKFVEKNYSWEKISLIMKGLLS